MTTEYLLPCPCGEKLAVDGSQAGLSVRCRCGAELVVPTLRGLAQLERAPAEAEPPQEWGPRQALSLAGSSVTALALLAALGLWLTAPRYPRAEIDAQMELFRNASDIEKLSPKESLDFWNRISQSLSVPPQIIVDYEAAARVYRGRMRMALVTAGAGLLILGAAYLVPKPAAAHPARR